MKPTEKSLPESPWIGVVRGTAVVLATPFAWTGAVVAWIAEGIFHAVVLLARHPQTTIFAGGLLAGLYAYHFRPMPALGQNEALDLLAAHSPALYQILVYWKLIMPTAGSWLAGYVGLTVWRVWGQSSRRGRNWGMLPEWPQDPDDDAPTLVVGEVHHPIEAREIGDPSWLTLPEKGLYTGIAIFGAVGTGKTSACMYPFARQLLSWKAHDPARRPAALILEVKGDFCYQVQEILAEAGRSEDYIEIGLGTGRRWNPLSSSALDPYSLAYTISSLLNQLFGKGREPFWQQAYTNLCRWIIETHRMLPGEWVTLQDVYRCAIDSKHFEKQIKKAEKLAEKQAGERTRRHQQRGC